MKAWRANGFDYFDTYDARRELLDHVRAGNGPAAIELDTERFYGHFEGDPQRYRGPGELDRIRETRDCLKAFRASVTGARLLTAADLDALDAEVLDAIEGAGETAGAAPGTTAHEVTTDGIVNSGRRGRDGWK